MRALAALGQLPVAGVVSNLQLLIKTPVLVEAAVVWLTPDLKVWMVVLTGRPVM